MGSGSAAAALPGVAAVDRSGSFAAADGVHEDSNIKAMDVGAGRGWQAAADHGAVGQDLAAIGAAVRVVPGLHAGLDRSNVVVQPAGRVRNSGHGGRASGAVVLGQGRGLSLVNAGNDLGTQAGGVGPACFGLFRHRLFDHGRCFRWLGRDLGRVDGWCRLGRRRGRGRRDFSHRRFDGWRRLQQVNPQTVDHSRRGGVTEADQQQQRVQQQRQHDDPRQRLPRVTACLPRLAAHPGCIKSLGVR